MLTRATEALIEQSLLYPGGFISPLEIEDAVTRALAEDLGRAGDVTSIATIPPGTPSRTVLVARKAGTIAGLPLVAACFRKLSPDIEIVPHARDGASGRGQDRADAHQRRCPRGAVGRARGAQFRAAICPASPPRPPPMSRKAGAGKTRICCTRKTTPGLRALEKYAVRCGGGFNHRFGLDDAILIKDNHIAVAGGIRAGAGARHAPPPAIWSRSRSRSTRSTSCSEVLDCGLRRRGAARQFRRGRRCGRRSTLVAGRLVIEASGGITLDSIAEIAATGVDYASSGALTHSAPALDVGLDIEI